MRAPLIFSRSIFLILIVLVIAACSADKIESISVPTDREFVEKGRALVRGMAACGFCHGASADPASALQGGRTITDIYGAVVVPNITPARSGIGAWTARRPSSPTPCRTRCREKWRRWSTSPISLNRPPA